MRFYKSGELAEPLQLGNPTGRDSHVEASERWDPLFSNLTHNQASVGFPRGEVTRWWRCPAWFTAPGGRLWACGPYVKVSTPNHVFDPWRRPHQETMLGIPGTYRPGYTPALWPRTPRTAAAYRPRHACTRLVRMRIVATRRVRGMTSRCQP